MQLRKYHGLGNDFLILLDAAGTQPYDADLARAVCDRHRGIGADGLVRVSHGPRFELLNADGSRAETSGNGLRCAARAVVDAGWDVGTDFSIATDAGPRQVALHGDGTVTVDMGPVTVEGEHVDVGNPHRVVLVDDLATVDGRGQPDLNLEFVVPGPGPDEITMRVFERGVGETLACGSGACAAAAVAHAKGLVGTRVVVHQLGGDATVEVDGGRASLTGPAQFVFEVEWPWR
ncbi:MAG: diaminopimelate epimerase [Acidimicrobiia bacterium]